MSGPPVDDVLAALDLSRAEPGRGLLEALFSRFLARVPFETVSKILRHADVADPQAKPRTPEIFWTDFLEWGAGGTCYARVAAFRHLLEELGFSCRIALGRIEKDFDHAALLVSSRGGAEWIADVGFPLPALLPAAPAELETGLGAVRVSRAPRGWLIELLEGPPASARRIEIFDAPVSEEELAERWRATFREGSKFLSRVGLRTQTEARALSFAEGELRIDDAHSRLTLPLPAPRAPRLEEVFGVGAAEISRAFGIVGEKAPASAAAVLTAWLEVEASPEQAWESIATSRGHAALLSGIGETSSTETTGEGWRVTLSAPSRDDAPPAPVVVEEARPNPQRRELHVTRRSGATTQESRWRVEVHAGRTHLTREAHVTASPEELLRHDALRGRLAASLAVDLVAWARELGR
ncbi:MAG TPA: arylamine N-acetyltransferase [Thermoanaerobaculia bacterium]